MAPEHLDVQLPRRIYHVSPANSFPKAFSCIADAYLRISRDGRSVFIHGHKRNQQNYVVNRSFGVQEIEGDRKYVVRGRYSHARGVRQELRVEDVAPVARLYYRIADKRVLLLSIGLVESPEAYTCGCNWRRLDIGIKKKASDTHVVSSPPLSRRSPS